MTSCPAVAACKASSATSFETISQTTDNLISLVNTLLDITRIQVGKVKLDLQDNVDIEKILETTLPDTKLRLKRRAYL